MKKIIKHELVEVNIPAGTTLTRFMFPDIANLRNTKILGLQIYENPQVPFSVLSQKPVTNANINTLAFVSFANYGGKYFLNKAPARMFQTFAINSASNTAYETDIKSFTMQMVNYPQSFVEVSQSVALLALVDTVFLFSVYYYDINDTTDKSSFQSRK